MIEFQKGSASSKIEKFLNQVHEEYEQSNGISDKYFEVGFDVSVPPIALNQSVIFRNKGFG